MAGLGFEETELRLGLPGGGGRNVNEAVGEAAVRSSGKRGFDETIDLKLKLQLASAAAPPVADEKGDDKEVADGAAAAEPLSSLAAATTTAAAAGDRKMKRSPSQSSVVISQPDPEKPRVPNEEYKNKSGGGSTYMWGRARGSQVMRVGCRRVQPRAPPLAPALLCCGCGPPLGRLPWPQYRRCPDQPTLSPR